MFSCSYTVHEMSPKSITDNKMSPFHIWAAKCPLPKYGWRISPSDMSASQWTQENKGVSSMSTFAGTLTTGSCHLWNLIAIIKLTHRRHVHQRLIGNILGITKKHFYYQKAFLLQYL